MGFHSQTESQLQLKIQAHIKNAVESFGYDNTMNSFAKYASRESISNFLVRDKIFRKILKIQGSIIEFGVFAGRGLMTWAQLSSVYEPIGGMSREIFGFDTFQGFPHVDEIDNKNTLGRKHSIGNLHIEGILDDINISIELYEKCLLFRQSKKIHLIKGDFLDTSEQFFINYPHVIPALLYIDFDLYAPTRKALEVFYKKMPKGSIIVFDEANFSLWPGETQAIYEVLDIKKIKLQKIGMDSKICYTVIE